MALPDDSTINIIVVIIIIITSACIKLTHSLQRVYSLSCEHAQDNDWRLIIKWLTQVSWKMVVEIVCVCVHDRHLFHQNQITNTNRLNKMSVY